MLVFPYQSGTATMRKTLLLFMDIFVLFYAFSRLGTRERLTEVLASFLIEFGVMAPIAIFESVRGWLLYTGIAGVWGDPNVFSWLFRGDSLRAQAAANHSINLGFPLVVGTRLLLSCGREASTASGISRSLPRRSAASWSLPEGRGSPPFAWALSSWRLGPDAVKRLAGGLAALGLLFALMYVRSPQGIRARPSSIQHRNQETIEYRRLLAEVSWTLIQQHPFFGDPFVASRMESLRQGQGIIDIVNGYIYTALFNGLVGLALLLGFSLLALFRGFAAFGQCKDDRDAATLGAALIACMVAALVYVATAGYNETLYVLFGLSVSYPVSCRKIKSRRATSSTRSIDAQRSAREPCEHIHLGPKIRRARDSHPAATGMDQRSTGVSWGLAPTIYFLMLRDIKVRYKQTVLGVAWAVLQPVMSMLVFTVIFGRLAKMPSEGFPYAIFVYTGLLPWTFFSTAVSTASRSLVNQQALLTKIYLPRLFVPSAAMGSGVVDFAVSFVFFGCLMAYYGVPPGSGASGRAGAGGAHDRRVALRVGLVLSAVTVTYPRLRLRHAVPDSGLDVSSPSSTRYRSFPPNGNGC